MKAKPMQLLLFGMGNKQEDSVKKKDDAREIGNGERYADSPCSDPSLWHRIARITPDGERHYEASYDAWGRQTVTLDEIGLYRGFTGHENIGRTELVHMDGRVYDSSIGRFLSPDNYVQLPENSQSYNRYSSCINNPLKYTDPTGQFFQIGFIGASLLAADAFANAMTTDSGSKFFISSAISILSPAVAGAIGGIFGHDVGSFGNELLRAGAHGFASGVMNALQGENFGVGFASGAFASFAGSGAQWAGLGTYGVLDSTTLFGGIGSSAFGGDFLDGAMTGLNIGLYNHTWEEGGITYNDDDPNDITGLIEEVVIKPTYSIAASNFVGGLGTLAEYAGTKWNGLKTATKSKTIWDFKKYMRDKWDYRIKTPSSEIYRVKIPNAIGAAAKYLGRASIVTNLSENAINIGHTGKIGLGNLLDVTMAGASYAPGGIFLTAGYLGADYITYRVTGTNIRNNLNNVLSVRIR